MSLPPILKIPNTENVSRTIKSVSFATELPEVRIIPKEADSWATGQWCASQPSAWDYDHRALLARVSLARAEAELKGEPVYMVVQHGPTAEEIFDMHYRDVQCTLRRSGAIRGRQGPAHRGKKRPVSIARAHTFDHFLSVDQLSDDGSEESRSSVETHLSLSVSIELLAQKLKRRLAEKIAGHEGVETDT